MELQNITIGKLYDLSHTVASEALQKCRYPWEFLGAIGEFIRTWEPMPGYIDLGEKRFVHESASIADSASICGPCIIGPETEVRQCAFIRGNAIIGAGCVVGNSSELKNTVLFDGVQVPHFNYVGDSILGYRAHLGAGAVTSNVKSDKTEVVIHFGEERIPTGRKKVGAMLGDNVEVGCNSVLNPGTVVGRNTNIYPLSCVRGVIPSESIYKSAENIVPKRK